MVLNVRMGQRRLQPRDPRTCQKRPRLLNPTPVAPTNGRRKTANGSMNLFEVAAEENHSR